MFLRNSRLDLAAAVIVLMLTSVNTHAQRSGRGHSSIRDQVNAIIRADMDRELLLKTLPANNDNGAAKQAVLKQVREDFKVLQALNNKMMAEAWAKPSLDYAFVSDMVSRIRGRASRLKLNLNLPQSDAARENPLSNKIINNSSDFRGALMVLDRTIMSFVSNPVFQTPNTIEIKQGADARQALETVIYLADDLKKTASRLGKRPQTR
jgi:hypothetical protein